MGCLGSFFFFTPEQKNALLWISIGFISKRIRIQLFTVTWIRMHESQLNGRVGNKKPTQKNPKKPT
jgi:hypothetical protein